MNMAQNKKDSNLWLLTALLLVSLIVIAGCKSRKVEVQEVKEVIQKDVVLKKNDSIITDIRLKTLLENIIIEPIDENKQHSVSVITKPDTLTVIGNNARYFRKTATKDSTVSKKEKSNVEEIDKSKKYVDKKERFVEAKSDWEWIKKSFPWIAITALIIGVIIFLIRYVPKNKF